MVTKIVRYGLGIVVVVILVATLINQWGTKKANALVEAGDAAIKSANTLTEDGGGKFRALVAEANLNGFPGNRSQLEPMAREAADLLGKAAEQYRLAASKYEEASHQPVDKVVINYWLLKVKASQKLAESKEAFRQAALLFLDRSIEQKDALVEKLLAASKNAQDLKAEYEQLSAEADKVQNAHKDKFTS